VYTLFDPTGVSLTIVNEQGGKSGHILYPANLYPTQDYQLFSTRFSILDGDMDIDTAGNASLAWLDDGEAWSSSGLTRLRSTTILSTTTPQVTKHYYANGQHVASRVDGELYYILGDHLGSTSLVVDAEGGEVGHVIYDAYGQVVETTVPLTLTDRLFTGQVFDASTGLYYYNARYYDPLTGQFTQPDSLVADPLDPRAWNRFSYVYGNPVNLTDPSGHCVFGLDTAVCVVIAIGVGTGALIGGGAEYGIQVIETYQETGDWTEALAWENKDKNRIYVGAIIGGIAGGLTGGVGGIAGSGLRGFLIRTGTSALVNAGANASYVGAQAYFSDGASLETALNLSVQHIVKQGPRDLAIGASASILADVLAVGLNSFLASKFSPNPYYLPSPSYRVSGGLAGGPTSRAAGSSGLQLFREIPPWYPALRASTLVIPEGLSNTGLLTVIYDNFLER
jgi:RHS repeat-associated protein